MTRPALRAVAPALALLLGGLAAARADTVWVEAEKPAEAAVTRHPYWYDQVKRDQLSGGDFISNWGDKPARIAYKVDLPEAGPRELWVRANPVQASLAYRLNGGEWRPIALDQNQRENTNVAADGKVDLRFLAWVKVATVELKKGTNAIEFRMDSANNNHGMLDCFVLSEGPFTPRGLAKPGDDSARLAVEKRNPGWFAFDPPADPFDSAAGFDLRTLNDQMAGERGFIAAKGDRFVYADNGQPVRFWAVNGPASKGFEDLKREARMLAKRGVNLVRVHHGYFDEKTGALKPEDLGHAFDIVEAMRQEGIYTHFSIYFPLWLKPAPDNPVLEGYDGNKHPFAALYFDEDFQELYRGWWKALLTTPSPHTGKPLVAEPAVLGAEVINEDSYFFWTFSEANIPEPELRILETQFGDWLTRKYGATAQASRAWGGGASLPRDNFAEGRVAFRPLWNIANERTLRDQDTAAFLLDSKRSFYDETYKYLRDLGFKGLINASNWTTASQEYLGPLEKLSYAGGDFIDRHGYFGSGHKGDNAAWSIRDGHTYADRSALRFDPEEPGKPKDFSHPAADPQYAGKPSMISETTFNRPNRYRSEAPLFYAVYGAIQDSDAIVHFAQDSPTWSVKPGYFMQPWTLMSPAMIGQFPAAALIYRKALVEPGAVLVDLDLNTTDLLALKGSPLYQAAALDELRKADVRGPSASGQGAIDPLVHFAGRVTVDFGDQPGRAVVGDLGKYIDREKQVVSATHGQARLDYGRGLLTINAPAAQGLSGNLKAAGTARLPDLTIASPLDLGHIVAVALDGQPLAKSSKILLQVMSEEKAAGFETEPAGAMKRIRSIGIDPWLVRDLAGTVAFSRADAKSLRVLPLDANGKPGKPLGDAGGFKLEPRTLYYLITP